MRFFLRRVFFYAAMGFLGITMGAEAGQKEDCLAYWRFEGTPGGNFSDCKSEAGGACAVIGQTSVQLSTDTRPTYGQPAPEGGGKSSLSLENKSTTDNDGVFAVSEPLPETQGISGITVEAWIKPETIKSSQVVQSIGGPWDDGLQLSLWNDEGSVCYRIVHDGAEYAVVSPPGSISDNEWHHLAGVFGPNGLSLYIDGRLVAKRQKERVPWPDISGFSERIGIGAYVRNQGLTSVGHFFDGQIDEVRITGRELNPEDFLFGGLR